MNRSSHPYAISTLIPLTALTILLSLSGCVAVLGRTQAASHDAVTVMGTPIVVIDTFSGDIEVTTGPDGKVSAGIMKTAVADADLPDVEFSFSQENVNVRGKCLWKGANSVSNATCNLSVQVPAGSDVTLVAGNGNVTYRAAPGKTLSATVGNGDVTVTLPGDAQFDLHAAVGAGEVKNGFELTATTADQKGRVTGTVGAHPALAVNLTAGNGNITIEPAR